MSEEYLRRYLADPNIIEPATINTNVDEISTSLEVDDLIQYLKRYLADSD